MSSHLIIEAAALAPRVSPHATVGVEDGADPQVEGLHSVAEVDGSTASEGAPATEQQALPAANPPSPKTIFISKVAKQLGAAVQAPPAIKRQKKALPATFKPRRSRRVAKLSPEVVKGAAASVCRRLGFADAENKVTAGYRDEYSRLFDQPLSQEHLRALAALFGWNAPPEDEVRAGSEAAF